MTRLEASSKESLSLFYVPDAASRSPVPPFTVARDTIPSHIKNPGYCDQVENNRGHGPKVPGEDTIRSSNHVVEPRYLVTLREVDAAS